MGNSQSQASDYSDNEEEPQYNYHERVLMEAQRGISDSSINPSESISEDEQYHSAAEVDSIGSITPPRTRPESSSEGDSADETHDSEIEADVQNSENEGSASEAGEFVVPVSPNDPSPRVNLRSKKSCGRCNVSVFQEHDSIGPEIAGSAKRSDISFAGSANTTRRSQSLVSGDRSLISNQKNGTPLSPFMPIISPPGSQTTSVKTRNKDSVAVSPGKRKLEFSTIRSSGEETSSAPKNMATRDSTKRKRLGYFESSESEESDLERNVTPAKKGRFDSKSPKKQRRADRSSLNRNKSESDSDEKRYKKNRKTSSPGHSESDSEGSIDDRDRRRSSRKRRSRRGRFSPRRGRRKSSDYSSDERYKARKRRRSERQQSEESESSENEDEGRKGLRGKKSQNTRKKDVGHDISHENKTSPSSEQCTQTEMTQTESESNVTRPGIAATNKHIHIASNSNQPCHTLKMGNQAIRNVHGKVLPLRHQDEQNFASNSTETNQNNITLQQAKSNISNLKNILDNLRPLNSAFVSARSLSLLSLKRQAASEPKQNDNVNNSSNSSILLGEDNMTNIKNQNESVDVSSSDSDQGENVNSSVSPFKDIVLTPSHLNANTNSPLGVSPVTSEMVRGEKSLRNDSDMEVDTGTVELQTDAGRFSTPFTPNNREILKAHRGRSATERLKNFWSEKKKNIGSNLKSLFSKPKLESPRDSDRSWQSFLSSPASVSSASNTPQSTKAILTSSPQSKSPPLQNKSPPLQNKSPPLQNRSPPLRSNPPPPAPLRVLRSRSVTPVPPSISERKLSSVLAANQNAYIKGISSATGQSPRQTQPKKTSGTGNDNKYGLNDLQNQTSNVGIKTSNTTSIGLGNGGTLSDSAVQFLPRTSSYQVLHFRLLNLIDVSVSMDDIANQPTSGIINYTDGSLMHNVTDCSKRIAAKAGALMRAACNDYIDNKGDHLEAPDVLTTPAGGHFERSVESILHVVAPVWIDGMEERNSHNLMEVYANSLRFANERLGLDSISFPIIGEGIFPTDMCIQTFFDALLIFLAEIVQSTNQSTDLTDIRLVISDANMTDLAAALISSRLERIRSEGMDTVITETVVNYLGHHNENGQGNVSGNIVKSGSSLLASPLNGERTLSGRPRLKRPRL